MMLNILYTELNLGARFQSFGQYVVTGLYQDEGIKRVGSDEIIIGTLFDAKTMRHFHIGLILVKILG